MSRKRPKEPARTAGGRARTVARTAPRAGEAPADRTRVVVFALAALLVVAGAWAYSTSLAGVLVLDDVRAIARNGSIRSLGDSLSPPGASTVAGRPVANFTFALNYALAPADARDVFAVSPDAPPDRADALLRNLRGYHLLNLFIHLAAGLALFGVVRHTLLTERLRPRFEASATWLAFAVALLWLVHPLQTIAVTYVVQRVESLMALFYLLTMYCAIRAIEASRLEAPGPGPQIGSRFPGGVAWALCAIAACALGMATKEVMVTAPIAVWLWGRCFAPSVRGPGPSRLRPYGYGLAATWLVLIALVWHEHRAPSIQVTAPIVLQYLVTQAGVVAHYLRLAVVPSPLVFLYTWPLAASAVPLIPQIALLGALLAVTVIGIVRRHPLAFAGAWFFLILAPTSSVLPIITEVAAEQRMYLPLAAVVATVVIGAYVSMQIVAATKALSHVKAATRGHAVVGLALVAVTAVVLGTGTRARNRDYWTEEGLWRDTVAKQPQNARARVAYGVALLGARRFAEAEEQLRAAVALDVSDPVGQSRLGAALAAQGKLDEAIPRFERALALRPDDPDAHRMLGQAYAMRQQDAAAVEHFTRALEIQGDDPVLLGHLAQLRLDSTDPSVRDPVQALNLAARAAELTREQDLRTVVLLATAQAATGQFARAAASAREAADLARAQGNGALVEELERRVRAYGAKAK